jgi:long-chain fatty acid transport protein
VALTTRRARSVIVVLVAAAVALLATTAAHAGGMFLPGRGARGLGRAGSFVAGVDDGSALYYNPAGLAAIDGVSLLADGALVFQRVHYDRIDSGGNHQPGVDGSIDILPIPTLAITWKPKKLPWLTVAGGAWVPYLGLQSYPETGPQRYSLISLRGSALAVLELAAAFRVNEHFWIGAGFQNMIIRFRNYGALSACTEVNCAPEDPSFDSPTQLTATQGFVPSGILGAIIAYPKVRGGVSLQLPFWINADSTVRSRLPTDPMFASAMIVGDQATASFTLPLMLRIGVEYRPLDPLRIELGIDYESWSMQDKFTIVPHGIYIDNTPGIGKYYLPTLTVTRGLQDSFSVHVGGEYEIPELNRKVIVRAGYLFESSATPDETMSVLTADGQKHMLAVGLGWRVWKVRLDIGYAHIFTPDRDVTSSAWLQINPIKPSLGVAVGNGHYAIDTDVLALGVDGRF